MKLKKYIKLSNKIIEMPYNKLNFKNYKFIMEKLSKRKLLFRKLGKSNVISLMSSQNKNSGLLITGERSSSKPNIYIVGKGILFDSGGYNLKSTGSIVAMHTDMAGMAIATTVASYCTNELGMDNIHSFSPVSANLIHKTDILPGDKIKIGDKLVSVDNTDGEGRLILASALVELQKIIKPNDIIITVATLTGAVAYAIGTKATAVIGGRKLVKNYLQSASKALELACELPIWKYIEKVFKKKDISNTHPEKCGTITAAAFLKAFVRYPKNWCHLDIAYSATNRKGKATGQPIKSLVEFIKEINN